MLQSTYHCTSMFIYHNTIYRCSLALLGLEDSVTSAAWCNYCGNRRRKWRGSQWYCMHRSIATEEDILSAWYIPEMMLCNMTWEWVIAQELNWCIMQQKLIELLSMALRKQESNRKAASCIDSVQSVCGLHTIQEHWWSITRLAHGAE